MTNTLKKKIVKGWAITTPRGVLVGGGTKDFGYIPFRVYSTKKGAEEGLQGTRNDIVIPCEIILFAKILKK